MSWPKIRVIAAKPDHSTLFPAANGRLEHKDGHKQKVPIRAGDHHDFLFTGPGDKLTVTAERNNVSVVIKNLTTVAVSIEDRQPGGDKLDNILAHNKSYTVKHNHIVKVFA